jgi:hypothetical protein
VARAEAEAAKIFAATDIEISDLQRRAIQRRLAEDERTQANIEEVVRLAIPHLEADADASKVEEDWLARFFDDCKTVSDEEMQSLWARILAGEANHAGTFSKRTLKLVADLDKRDADMFTTLCRFHWKVGTVRCPVVFDEKADMYTANDLTFGVLNHLDDIGLATFQAAHNFGVGDVNKNMLVARYGEAKFLVILGDGKTDGKTDRLDVGHVLFTKPGEELASICVTSPVEGLADYVTDYWFRQGRQTACILPRG